ncbi:ABC transporter, ATP-binding protein [Synechococcus sp. PCC 7335]|uniref:NHLP bacteriocin export ABC transporter permease/ATPase subunit n=1 Tax=Synechococcus sp. (strain ATCC 29403 / PCC 7335) TaxID=91464 RepID=UPI00017EE40C|nr:NHLP bacteriocin export ABC transporter permease/ATPase subunit [Synechococcus sp. PCC 7335]EDX84278.1 ABC transporter, ATP-binding protein [Synechococcus sp. PCC 7335]
MVSVLSPSSDKASDKTLAGNETFLLEKPGSFWQVSSGSVGVFAVTWSEGKLTGPRYYLFTVSAGDYLLGCTPQAYGLVAIAFEPSVITPSLTSHTLAPFTSWFEHFSSIEDFPRSPAPIDPNPSEYISLRNGIRYGSQEKMVWIKVKQGNASWLDHIESPLTPDVGLFPIAKGTWLQAQGGSVELQVYSPEAITKPDEASSGIECFHRYVLNAIERIILEKGETGLRQFQQRQSLNQKTADQALRGLASLLRPEDNSFLSADTPLLVAAGAVARVLDVSLRAPNTSENFQQVKEPLEAIARASQLRLRQILLRGPWWTQDSGPMVVYTQADHLPMALLPIKDNRYELLDPVSLNRTLVTESIANTLDPRAFVFYRPLPEGQLNAWVLLKFALQGHKKDLWMILLTGVAMSLLGMAIPQATAVLIDDAIPYGNEATLIELGLLLLAVAFGRSCFQFAQAIAAMRIETSSDSVLQAAVWDRLLKLHPSFFRDYSSGDLQARVSSVNTIRRKLSGTALDAILSGAFAFLNLGLLFYYSASLAVLALFVAVLVMGVTIVSGILLLKKQRPLLELDGEIYGLMVQLINGVSKLRLAGAEPRAFGQWAQRYRQQIKLDLSTQKLEDGVDVFNTAMPTLTSIALFAIATTLVGPDQSAGLSSGTFLAFVAAFAIFINGATSLSLTVIEVLEVIPLWMRSQPILAATPELSTQKSDPGRLSGRICLDHVTFRYREDGPLILDDVTVGAHPGEFIALVGPSGSGKSTVLRLLLGFESPQSGTVYYDNQDVAGLDVAAVRRQLGVVLQNGRINAGSLFENISGGALISLEDAWRAAEMAGFAEDIRSFPMEMHTVISEGGGNLSGGQRQRLMIARALALNPNILLLDEATSALDNRTQAIVSQSLDRLNVTRIVVAHRLSTIRHADRIYVIKSGRVVQQGSFDQLAQEEGVFKQLIKRQMA